MNIDNLNKLITHLENEVPEKDFDMINFATQDEVCGTTMCIAGHAAILSGWATLDGDRFMATDLTPANVRCYSTGEVDPEAAAELWLGAQWPVTESPFYNYSIRTPQQAAQMMASIRDTYLSGHTHPCYPHVTEALTRHIGHTHYMLRSHRTFSLWILTLDTHRKALGGWQLYC